MNILGIDPGPKETAYCLVDENYAVVYAGKVENYKIIQVIGKTIMEPNFAETAIESLQSFGMPVGKEVFETAYMIGRIQQKLDDTQRKYTLYPRQEYAHSICGTGKISDSILRQALLLRFGGDKKDEPLHQLKGSSDLRSAYAVAVYHLDKKKWEGAK
jgi:Holliday junction resolvasome RuvABC endonuclease subunit